VVTSESITFLRELHNVRERNKCMKNVVATKPECTATGKRKRNVLVYSLKTSSIPGGSPASAQSCREGRCAPRQDLAGGAKKGTLGSQYQGKFDSKEEGNTIVKGRRKEHGENLNGGGGPLLGGRGGNANETPCNSLERDIEEPN